jgi:hypothetical protein
LAGSVINERQIEFNEMHRGEFGGGLFARICPSRRLSKVTIFC